MSFLQTLESHLNLIPVISAAIQEFKAIGASKETTVVKIGQIVEVSAALGEQVPVPLVASISATVETFAEAIFGTNPTPTPAP